MPSINNDFHIDKLAHVTCDERLALPKLRSMMCFMICSLFNHFLFDFKHAYGTLVYTILFAFLYLYLLPAPPPPPLLLRVLSYSMGGYCCYCCCCCKVVRLTEGWRVCVISLVVNLFSILLAWCLSRYDTCCWYGTCKRMLVVSDYSNEECQKTQHDTGIIMKSRRNRCLCIMGNTMSSFYQ